jgi:hypothetical protein
MNKTHACHIASPFCRGFSALGAIAFIATLAVTPTSVHAAARAKNPAGKVYVSRVAGGSQITFGDKVEELAPKSAYLAQGALLETKPSGSLAMVFSNGTGIFLDQDTHIEVKRFAQEPFIPSRTDLEAEPSVSQTEVFLSRGIIAVSTSKLAPGSTMTYRTSLGSINLHGGRMVMAADGELTKISLLEGTGTVYGGENDLGGKVIHAGEQAIIRPGPPGQPNIVQIGKIPANELAALEAKAAMAYGARRTVLFQTDEAGEVVVVQVVPASLPVKATISPSQLPN